MTLLVMTLVHDFSGDGWNDAYFCAPIDPNVVIRQNIENIRRFVPDSIIMIHVNKTFDKFDESIADIPGVHVCSKRFMLVHGSSHLSAITNMYNEAIEKKLDFDYVTFTYSGEMFVKEGAYEYMQEYEYGIWYPPRSPGMRLHSWLPYVAQMRMAQLGHSLFKDLFDPNDYNNYGASFLEGSFYHRSLFTEILNWFKANYDLDKLSDYQWPAEELVIPTLAFHLAESANPGKPINGIFLDKGHKPLDSMDNVHKIRNNEPVLIWNNNHWGGTRMADSTHLYTVKRVNRIPDDPVRQAILSL